MDLPQSALAPAGQAARDIVTVTTVLTVGAIVVLVVVMALLAYGARREGASVSEARWVVSGGIVFPVIVLTALFFYSTRMSDALHAAAPSDAVRIDVAGWQWWWEVRYPGLPAAVSANEVHVPVGAPVELRLTSPDVIHAFWVPSLAGKLDMVPGRAHRLTFRADAAGVFRGQCAEYCGAQHAQMALVLVAEPAEAFAAWVAAQAAPAAAPSTPDAARGLEAFHANGCAACHTIRGTEAQGQLGPDLTHVAGRRSLAAGSLRNDAGALRAWVAAGSVLKPGNRMPSYAHLETATLDAIAAYLATLR
jgi:cytochrome c oxidase subunit 2